MCRPWERPDLACSKVLVVEDDPLILMAAAEALREAGFIVTVAETADEAARVLAAAAGAFDAVFSDIETPGELDGLALARLIGETWPAIGLVVTSGRIVPVEGSLPSRARFLGKPYDLDHVTALIAQPA